MAHGLIENFTLNKSGNFSESICGTIRHYTAQHSCQARSQGKSKNRITHITHGGINRFENERYRFFVVCPEWTVTWWWKSTTGLAVGTVSRGQVRPSWGGLWSKPKANSRSDEQKSHIRHMQSGRACHTKQSPILPELCGVNVADIWEEGYCS